MNKVLINNINEVATDKDLLMVVGDFAFAKGYSLQALIERIAPKNKKIP